MATAAVYQLALHINARNRGFVEKYYLKTTTMDDSVTIGAKICQYRTGLMAKNTEMIFASVGLVRYGRQARSCLNKPLLALEATLDQDDTATQKGYYVNDPNVSIVYRIETAAGDWAYRHFRGVPDNWVRDFRVQDDTFWEAYKAGTNVPDFQDDLSVNTVIKRFLTLLRDNTQSIKGATFEGDPPKALTWDVNTWAVILGSHIGTRQTGRPFRLSRGRAVR